MPQQEILLRVLVLLLVCLVLLAAIWRARGKSRASLSPAAGGSRNLAPDTTPRATIPWRDPLIEIITLATHLRTFAASGFNQSLLREHGALLQAVARAIPQAASRRELFPRRPRVIPRLLGALRDNDSSLKELVDIVNQDPVLSGDVMKLANSAFYRVSREPVDSIQRAVVLLGVDGLRALIASSVVHPLFEAPRGAFENFAESVWRLAERSALCAQHHARVMGECDSAAAHLLALIQHTAHMVLFRLTLSLCESPPPPEVLVRVIDEHASAMARLIAADWELPDTMCAAFDEQIAQTGVDSMSPLSRSLYFGRIVGMASLLPQGELIDEGAVLALLERKGIAGDRAATMWRMATHVEG
jgi:HD-like signal output (HDOD) protein